MATRAERISWLALAGVGALVAGSSGALAGGTLLDVGVLELTFADASGTTAVSAENDGSFLYTVSGGTTGGERFARYLLDGTADLTFASGIDFRSIFTDNSGNLFAKEYGQGNVYSLTSGGMATFLFTLNDPQPQTSADFNGDDSELYTRSGALIRRYNSANGSFIGSFTLQGMGPNEDDFPEFVQMETNLAGRIFTYADGIVSEWDLAGIRIGTSTIPIDTPSSFLTTWSFGVGGDDRIYLSNEISGMWEVYDVGIGLSGGCLTVTSQEVLCHADGTTFTVNIEGLNACTGGTSSFTFTASGGAVGEEMCFTLLVDDGGFCCSTEICVTIPDCGPSDNLLANPGFETGNFNGWTISGNSVQTLVNTDGTQIPGVAGGFVPTFQNVRSGEFGANALVRTGPLEQVYLDQIVSVLPSTLYAVGYYVGVDSPDQPAYGFGNQNVILVDGIPLALTGLGQIDMNNGAVGPGPDDFRHVFGSFTSGPAQKSAMVSFRITGSGLGRAGFSLDDFHFTAALPCDLDGDGIVGIVDFLALIGAWGSCSDCTNCPADFDGDCSVGILDLLILLGNWA